MSYNVGVNIIEGQGANPISGVSTAVVGIMGTFLKGPLNQATPVTNMSQFETLFGDRPATGSKDYYAVKAFFAKVGTAQLYLNRIASGTAAKATRTLPDRQSSPVNTIKIDAYSEGTWGNALAVKVVDAHILTTTLVANADATDTSAQLTSVGGLEVGSDIEFDNGTNQEVVRLTQVDAANRTVHWSGGLTYSHTTVNCTVQSQEFSIEVYLNGVLQETHRNLSMNDSVSFFVEKAVSSTLIAVTDLKASDSDYEDMPAAMASPSALTSGADGLADLTGSHYSGSQANKTGVYAFDNVPDLFRFCCPYPLLTDVDQAAAYLSLVQSLLDYANSRGTVQFYADTADNLTPAQAVTFGANFEGRRLALFYPWLKVIESGKEVFLPPSAFALAAAVEKDGRRGVHKSIGNEKVASAIDLRRHVSRAEGETLNDAGINTIRKFAGEGILIYGGRTKSAVTSWRFIDQSEYFNYIARSLEVNLRDVVFEPNDAALWASVKRRVTAFMSREQDKGALFDASNPQAQAFLVVVDETNNPSSTVALGELHMALEYVKVSPVEKFVVHLTSSPTGLTVAAA